MQHPKRSLLSNTLPLSIGVNFVLALLSCIAPCPAKAQITPDATLGNKNSVVVPDNLNGNPIDRINGGAIQGSNLFHSFLEFNIGEGARAYFTNPSGISNILTRVTGNNASNILGTLGVLGNANLFLINPKGIVFGPNASLDLRGSFVASSADSLVFNNGLEFSATNPQAPPLLTVNIPVGLRLRENSASIVNQSSAVLDLLPGNTLGLVGGNVILDGGSLKVAGGRIELGGLTGAGIVGFDIQESQGIPRVASLSFPNGVERADVSLSNEAVVNVAAGGGGSIAINGRNVNIVGGGQLLAGIDKNSGSPGTQAGNIEINATDQVVFTGIGPSPKKLISAAFNQVETGAQGNSGDINIKAASVEVREGAQLSASTSGKGDAGKILINADKQVLFDGESSGVRSAVFSQVIKGAIGKSGGILIETPILEVKNSAFLDASTLGSGNAGTITINATDKVLFDGKTNNGFSSYLLSQAANGAMGKSGDILIKTPILEVTNGAFIDASTLGSGNAGTIIINATDNVLFDGKNNNGLSTYAGSLVAIGAEGISGSIVIKTPILKVTNGAKVITNTFGKGNSGLIKVTADDSVFVDGTSSITSEVGTDATGASEGITINTPRLQISNAAIVSADTHGNGNAGNIDITADTIELSSAGKIRTNTSASSKAGNITLNVANNLTLSDFGTAVLAETENTSTSDGGNISVIGSPKNVLIKNGAELSVNSRGSGIGGNISPLQANSLTLDQGTISAETAKGKGGDITLDVADLLLMQGDSKITTNAGLQSQPGAIGTGGNIGINTQLLVALPSKPKGSDITANATYGKGGRVDITATGIFGIEFRDKPRDLFNDITASSEFGGNPGVVNINRAIDPSRNLVELPANVVDPNDQIAQNPCSKGVGSEFTITGRGGLPASPNEDLSQEATQVGLVEPVSTVSNIKPPQKTSSGHNLTSQIPNPIVPVQEWVFNNKGEIVLTAYNPNVTGTHRLPKNLSSCPAR